MTASNNDPYPPRMMAQHHAHDVMRAIESDRWAVTGHQYRAVGGRYPPRQKPSGCLSPINMSPTLATTIPFIDAHHERISVDC
jgi:hypothetical protein